MIRKTVQKNGIVHNGVTYWSDKLDCLAGIDVLVKPQGGGLKVTSKSGRFVCLASPVKPTVEEAK
jgi:hypothetical protein